MIYPVDALIMAPLAGFTDLPYRRSMRRCGCKYAFTEMIDVSSLAYAHSKSFRLLERGPEEEFLGVQLVGCDPEHLARAVRAVNSHGEFDVLDLNLGCPVPKVAKKGAGAALGREPDRAVAFFAAMAERSRFPVTAKLRILDEVDPEPTVALALRLEAAGARALTVHGRIMRAFYAGAVKFPVIRAVRDAVKIPVIANGGVMSAPDYHELRRETGCTRVMLARGAMGNPWIFRQLGGGEEDFAPSVAEFCDAVECHIGEMMAYYGEELGLKIARKVVLDYLKGRGYGGEVKQMVCTLAARGDWVKFMARLRQGPADLERLSGSRRLRSIEK